ncbi:MAG: hypothetical protein QOI19_1505 [Thermoleophilaceae bacterium]|jgi:exopolysaccharide biosynthesis polyprenyl glycosylphosphotransferase|nr:hypothetical protein [Thermoleophilaceae bacterium]
MSVDTNRTQASAQRAPTAERADRPGGLHVRRGSPAPDSGPRDLGTLKRALALADFHAIIVGGLLAILAGTSATEVVLGVVLPAPVWLFVGRMLGLYAADERRLCHRTSDDIPMLLNWAVVCAALTGLLLPRFDLPSVFALGAGTFVFAVILRGCVRTSWRRLTPPRRGLVLGSPQTADRIARKLELEPGNHFEVVRQVAVREDVPANGDLVGVCKRALAEDRIDRAVIAMQDVPSELIQPLVDLCRRTDVRLTIVPPAGRALGTAARLDHIAEMPLVEFSNWHPSPATLAAKRALDVVLSGAAVLILGPLMLLIALLVRLDSPGPGIYRQRRAGRNGVPFTIYKFRTMVRDADRRLPGVVNLADLKDPMYKLTDDPRVTRLGRLLRRTSLDELPQVVNVLMGSMSLVGPRPEDVNLVERYDAASRVKLEMRPGMTGPMQVFGRGDLTFDERIAVEREYIENYSLGRDIKILMRTVSVVLTGKGAY